VSVAAYDLVSFDLDGTLVDTASEIAEAVNLALEDHGLARRPLNEITALIGAGTHALMLKLLVQMDIGPSSTLPIGALLQSLDQRYGETTGSSARVYTGAAEALQALRAAGVKLACVTNKELRHAQRVLAVTGLAEHFDLVIGGDSLPEKKPHPSVLRQVAADFGGPPLKRCGHVGDSRIDVHAARNAGFAAWAVPYGYNGGEPVALAAPDRLFPDLLALADHVLGGLAMSHKVGSVRN
jgi:phosphoglycolate phosphatase